MVEVENIRRQNRLLRKNLSNKFEVVLEEFSLDDEANIGLSWIRT